MASPPPPPPPPPALSSDFDPTLLSSGDLVLPFQLGDVDQLAELEVQLLARRRGGGLGLGLGSPAESLQLDVGRFEDKLRVLAALVRDGAGDEAQWVDVVTQQSCALYRALLLLLAHVPLSGSKRDGSDGSDSPFHTLVHTLWVLGTLAPAHLFDVCTQHPASLERLLHSILPELSAEELAPRLRLLDQLLVQACTPAPHRAPIKIAVDFEEAQNELLNCVAHPATHIFSLATTNMLLLNTLDAKHCLHRLVLSKQRELSQASPSSPTLSSSASGALYPLSTASLSRLSQELITLVNSGRLPPSWTEEADQFETHSGTRNASLTGVVDMYQSSRRVTREPPPRETDCTPITSAALSFLAHLFAQNTALDLLYTNDITVLTEVLIRKSEDRPQPMQLALDYLLCLAAVVSWREFATRPFLVAELRALLQALASDPEHEELSDEQIDQLSEQEQDDYDTRCAIRELAEMTDKKLAAVA